uniref:DUF834 domain-containing protein n=1 Tax=Oryza barthii TaxID=65489 RepID=A0A0D3HIC1_9ORYZ
MGRQNRQIAHLGEEMRRRWRGEEAMGGGGDGWSSGETNGRERENEGEDGRVGGGMGFTLEGEKPKVSSGHGGDYGTLQWPRSIELPA